MNPMNIGGNMSMKGEKKATMRPADTGFSNIESNDFSIWLTTKVMTTMMSAALFSLSDLGKCYFCSCVVLMSTCSEYYD